MKKGDKFNYGKKRVAVLYVGDNNKVLVKDLKDGIKINVFAGDLSQYKPEPKIQLPVIRRRFPIGSCPQCGTPAGNYIRGIECPGCGFMDFKEWLNQPEV